MFGPLAFRGFPSYLRSSKQLQHRASQEIWNDVDTQLLRAITSKRKVRPASTTPCSQKDGFFDMCGSKLSSGSADVWYSLRQAQQEAREFRLQQLSSMMRAELARIAGRPCFFNPEPSVLQR